MKKPTLSSDWIRTIITILSFLVLGTVGYTKLTDTVTEHEKHLAEQEKSLEKLDSTLDIQREDINKLFTTQAISNEQYSQVTKNLDEVNRELRRLK